MSVPKSVQDVIKIDAVYSDGIFLTGRDRYSKTFRFTDINYAVSSKEDKEANFLRYSEILNSLENGISSQITIINRKLKKAELKEIALLEKANDDKDKYRKEINDMLTMIANGANAIVQDKYVTLTIQKKTVEEARSHFNRVGADLTAHFSRLGSKCTDLDLTERLRIIHDFCRPKESADYHFDLRDTMHKGQHFKDYITPDGFEFMSDYFKIGDRFGRVLFIRDYPSYIKDSVVWELTDTNRNMIFNFDIVPVSTEEAQKFGEKQALGIETNIANYQRKQNANNNYTAVIPYDLEQQRKEVREFLDDLTTRDQKMFKVVITVMHTADTLEELNNDTEAIQATGRKHMCQLGVLKYQQLDGFNATLPIGINKIEARRTLTTESLAVFMPFKVQEIQHDGGVFQGVNVISKNMIIVNRKFLLNGNCFILGVSGSGKSFTAKEEMVNLLLSTDADVMIIDPEREYSALVEAMGGQVIELSAKSKNHINCLDINKEYAEGASPIAFKAEFVLSLFEQVMGKDGIDAIQKSIVDRCLTNVYSSYIKREYTGKVPTLVDLCNNLRKQPEPEALELATAMELFASGSHSTFAQKTNVNIENRLICYDILELGSQLMPIGMLVVLDSILNRITKNRAEGRETYIFIDEIYLLFQHEYSANFLFTLWKRVRKYGAYCTGITQNVDDLLQSHTARTMLANSEFIIMLNQGGTDREDLANLLQISETQMTHITNVEVGHGLVKVGSALVPFERKFPKNTELYKLMTTKVGELN
ncbi:MAG: ATP-binding protein [Clostridia bacterium]|nr:ATP-binding protein [Clostridia bacterium]